MIISHTHRFIFLKTRKTAGTSIEIALSEFCGPDDIVTPVTPEDEAIRRQLGFAGPRNFVLAGVGGTAARGARRERPGFFNHVGAAFVRDHVPPEVWNGYFKFAFERNPFDKAVSGYFWRTRDPRPTLGEYVASAPRHLLSDWGIYTIDDRIAVDFIGRYESLAADLEQIYRKIGLHKEPSLPRAKGGYRSDRRHYSELVDQASRARIESVCAMELRSLGYRWDAVGGESAGPANGGARA